MPLADDRPSKTLMIHRRFVLAEARHGKNTRHVAGFVFSLGVYRVFQTGICSSPPTLRSGAALLACLLTLKVDASYKSLAC